MRRFIIDTDTGSDDAIAIMMMLLSDDVQVEAVTTVCGNIGMEQATLNALATIEVVGKGSPPVYRGAHKPLMRELVTAQKCMAKTAWAIAGSSILWGNPKKTMRWM
ncbi:nucleoside hydrolase [Ruthenibacterium lactatiformans]|uniref:nucleoside hydrolase n=1 Tax=Ruthenibacterium lactatiformans TaxID=1550024 RepID=UPI00196750A5|nr:nucleoside hydrolase [Ruthenibacterium lactatiformans]MBN3016758.1 nucleoside hydrolase [Ruthenibacterium lactatiformans]